MKEKNLENLAFCCRQIMMINDEEDTEYSLLDIWEILNDIIQDEEK